MSDFVHSVVVDGSSSEVFDWHARPGAVTRLTPPWQPVRVVREASSLRDGTAVLRFPLGLTWEAEHQADGFEPGRQFVDQLANLPLRAVLSWRHTHRFDPEEGDRTRVTDVVRTTAPSRALRSMFRYRHEQLAGDLASRARARAWSRAAATVAVTGASGLVGTAVCALLGTAGHRVVRLVRHPSNRPDERHWDPDQPAGDLLEGVDVVIHLAGASIAGRFTEAHKAAIRDSRVGPTRRLAAAAAQAKDGPTTFVCASAIGYYGHDRGDTELTEDHEPGGDFLAGVVGQWEAATAPATDAGLRTVLVRTGIVQSPRGGALHLLHPLFAAGLGGRLGDGRQWQSWIGIDDLADIYLRAVLDTGLSGPVNAVAPHAVRNSEYTRALARALHRPALLPVPGLGPQVLLGSQGAREVALADQHVRPARLEQLGHTFRHPQLADALGHLLGTSEAARTD